MSLVPIDDLPSPAEFRSGWAALAAVSTANGFQEIWAQESLWHYQDGGGNWAAMLTLDRERSLLFGHDHEYSDTYFAEAAAYFGEEETDLLRGAPSWWTAALQTELSHPWIGFIYGWNGTSWERARYDEADGFDAVGLARDCFYGALESLELRAQARADSETSSPDRSTLQALLDADGQIDESMVAAAVPRGDARQGAVAARRFLAAPIGKA